LEGHPVFVVSTVKLFIHKLCAFLDCSNHKQFFLVKAFASITSAPPLRKKLAARLHLATLCHMRKNAFYCNLKWTFGDCFFCDTTLCLNKLTTYEPSFMVTRNCF